jgi:hypothetical protein
VNLERLDFAISVLERKHPTIRWTFSTWGLHKSEHHPSKDNYCGTLACAAGLIALDADAEKHGLYSRWVLPTNHWKLEISAVPFDGGATLEPDHLEELAYWLEVDRSVIIAIFTHYGYKRHLGLVTQWSVLSRLYALREHRYTGATLPEDWRA